MTEDPETPTETTTEHELVVQTSPAWSAGRGYPSSQSEDLLVSCVCGWRTVHGRDARGARREFERHLRKVAAGRPDLGSAARGRDEASEVLGRRRKP